MDDSRDLDGRHDPAYSRRVEPSVPPKWLWIGLALLLVVCGIAVVAIDRDEPTKSAAHTPSATKSVDPDADTDLDGILDSVEDAGWTSKDGQEFKTDPANADSDGDLLPDGLEAGALLSADTAPAVYEGFSDPGEPDTDGDDVGDADEYFLDINPALADTDDDGLDDGEELEFGSDPTLANGDGDSWSDAEELERESEPLAYDLSAGEYAKALEGGAKYGACYDCASDAGLSTLQIDSVAYLAGQIASGVAVVGDVRDFGYNLWKGNFVDAVTDGAGLIPGLGDAVKVTATLTKFAARSQRAASIVVQFARRLPEDVRKRLPDSLVRRGATLPAQLSDGPTNVSVYFARATPSCPAYVGITNDFATRMQAHVRNGRCFAPELIATELSRGAARSMEEACLVAGGFGTDESTMQNAIRSISTSREFYDDAVAWGTQALKLVGHAC